MSQSKLLCRITAKQASMMATIAIIGMIAILSAFFLVSDSASNSYATSVNSEITAEVDGTHYITLSAPDVTFSINPTDSAQLSKQSINVNVETNAPGGADLYLSMVNSTNALHLNGDTTSTAPAIEATASSVAANSLAANTWGYSTNDQTYSAVPTNDSDPALLAAVDGSTVGSSAGGVITASVPVYYAASVDTSIPAGSYSNRLAYSAVVDGGIITEATLTKIEIDGVEVDTMQPEVENTLEVTTNLMTNPYGTPRVYLETTDPSGYQECGSVTVSRNESGYMTITCKVTPTQAATGVTLHIVPKGSSDDHFCADGTYTPDTSDCEAGEWKWGSLVIDGLAIEDPVPYMQNFTTSQCASMAQGDQIQLVDSRDGKTYWVGKLPDNNCWMTQNLDLDIDANATYTSDNTNVTSDWKPTLNTTTSISEFSEAGSYDPDIENPENAANIGQHTHVGNYYQWSVATANYTGGGSSPQSICPKGWTIPSRGQYDALKDAGLSRSNFTDVPYYLTETSWILSDFLYGNGGFYWSSTYIDDFSWIYVLNLYNSGMPEPGAGYFGDEGMSVRCVATE